MSTNISRRDFIKGAAVSAVGVAAIGVAGCGDRENTEDTKKNAAEEFVKPDLAKAKYNVDIVIVGSGAAGMSAAVEAGQKGMKALLLETNSFLGGNTNFAEGIFGYNTKYQQAQGLNYDLNEMIQGEMEFSNYKADYLIIKEFVLGSNANIEWLESMGLKFPGIVAGGAFKTQHLYPDKGKSLINVLKPQAEKSGVTILTSTRGRALYQENGKIVGIAAQNDKETFAIRTKAVVLACSGFIQNPDMVAQLTKYNMDRMLVTANPGHVGDSLIMAYEVGGDQSSQPLFHLIWAGVEGVEIGSQLGVAACNEPILWVDNFGRRFVDESVLIGQVSRVDNALLNRKDTYSILDQDQIVRMTQEPCTIGFGSYTFAGTKLDKLEEQLNAALSRKNKSIFKADTIEELARKIGVDPTNLRATIDLNNKMYSEGKDTEFAKPAQYLRPIKTAPFYAFELKANVFATMGGIRVNTKSEVLTKDFEPIPGLYCAGMDCGGLNGDTYSYLLSASAQGYAVYSGRNSVQNALKYMGKA